MSVLIDLKKPQLQSLDVDGFQNLHVDGSKLVVSTDIVSQDVSFADVKSTSDTHTTQLQNVANDGSVLTLSSDIVVTGKATFNNVIENATTSVSVSDSFKITSDSQAVPGLDIQSSNTTQKPISISHDSVEIFSISATDGTITNVSVQSLESRATSLETRTSTAESDIDTLENEMDSVENRASALELDVSDHETRLQTEESNVDLLQSQMSTAQADLDAVESRVGVNEGEIVQLQTDLTQEISDRQSDITTEQTERQNADGLLSDRLDIVETKTQHITADADETVFDVASKVKWDTGDQYFTIKSRDTLSVSSSNTADKVLDFKSHQYSVTSNQYGTYDCVLQCQDGDGTAPFYRATLVKYSGSAIIYPVSSYKTSATYDHSTDTISFTFDDSITKDFVVSWMLVN